ncbi:ABC transporter permease subunit [Metabacillus fastidiosus]|uniref:ABC transporter permease subunit n=1 Tax=Metabacillus fastidiosus TaxID=1458 RepID=UPI003D2B3A43
MNKKLIWTIAKKDIRAITSNKQIWLPMLILPVMLCVFMPGFVIYFGKMADVASINGIDTLKMMIKNLPEGELRDMLDGLKDEKTQLIYLFVNYLLMPLFLLIPVLSSVMIAANSFVGEKERRTLESLLFAPIQIKDLFIGKVLASFIPTIALTYGSFILCAIVVNSLTYSTFNQMLLPNTNWIVLLFLLVPVISVFTILFNVLISARVKGFQEAQQLGGTVVLPVIAIMVSQAAGLFLLNPIIIVIIAAVLMIVNYLLLNRIAKMNERHVLFEKQVH